jgi:predicted RNA-binding protein YlqC (UPF0109 family)
MKQFLEYVIPNLVTHPDEVVVTEEEKDGVIHLIIQVNPEDVGRVIGKSGKIIKSLRQLVRVMAIKQGVRVNVDVADGNEQIMTPDNGTEEDASETGALEEVPMSEAEEDDLEVPQMETPSEDELLMPPEEEAEE